MNKRPHEAVPPARPIRDALARCTPLAQLRARLDDSRRRFDLVVQRIPEAQRAHVRPGPVDDDGWTLLADNAAVAAKLRQLQPLLEQAQREQGWTAWTTRIKVRPPGG